MITVNRNGWEWSDDYKCYYISYYNNRPPIAYCISHITTTGHQLPIAYCLGERHVYAEYDIESYGILYRGSTIDNWGERSFGYDLKTAIEWVQRATLPELGHSEWDIYDRAIAQKATTNKLSERVRPNSEAAPWVIDEIKILEYSLESAHKRLAENISGLPIDN